LIKGGYQLESITQPIEPLRVKKKHPTGLTVLFLTEMWERFSFYCMLSILSLYMNENLAGGGLGFSIDKTSDIYSWYISIVYFTPFIGGIIADRIFGIRKTIIIGGLFMMAGHFLLAFRPLPFFFSALCCLIIGNGCFKPNISVMLGNLYREIPEKKDDAYNIFYMGINLGAFFSPLVAASLRSLHPIHGWHYAFAAAGVGMIISLVTFLMFQRHVLEGENILSGSDDPAKREIQLSPRQAKKRVMALLVIFGVVIFFWMAFHQNGLTLTFWARDATKSDLGSALFRAENMKTPAALVEKLCDEENPTYNHLFSKLSPDGQRAVIEYKNSMPSADFVAQSLTAEFNRLIECQDFYNESAFVELELSEEIRDLIESEPQGSQLIHLNRFLLNSAYPNEIGGRVAPEWIEFSTEFDSSDVLFSATNILNPVSLIYNLDDETNTLGQYIQGRFSDAAKELHANYMNSLPPIDHLSVILTQEFNRIIQGENIYFEDKFSSVDLSASTMNLIDYQPEGGNLIRLNRLLIEDTYPYEISRRVQINPEIFQSVNPFFILIFTPLIIAFWNLLRRRTLEPTTAAKLGVGMLLTAGCYAIMASAAFIGGDYIQVNMAWLIGAYAVITMGELCLSPMGLSLVSKLAPWKIRSMMMGGWFAATAIGNKLSGLVGRYWDDLLHSTFFIILVCTSLFAALLLFIFLKYLNPIIKDAEEQAYEAAESE